MEFNDIVAKVDTIESERGYWFVRTDNGTYYQNYVENNFVAIGWNYVTIENLNNATPTGEEIKIKIAQRERLDLANSGDKGKATAIYNKLKAFKELRRGDLIIVPSQGSQRLAFGIVRDNTLYSEIDDPNCNHFKRRRVNWLENRDIDELDDIFYQVKITRHAISSVKRYDSHIDKVVKTLFKKDGYSHYVLDINSEGDINFQTLLELINSINELTKKLNEEFNLEEDLEETSIKLNLQSPGKIEFKFLNGKSLILLATLLGPLTLNNALPNIPQEEKEALEQFRVVNEGEVRLIEEAIEQLEIDRDKINSVY